MSYPSQVMTVRINGDSTDPYWLPVVDADGALVTEPGETTQVSLPGSIMFLPQGASRPLKLSECALTVTDRRTVWLTTEIDKGKGPGMGSLLGPVGAAVELASTVGSHAAAARRRGRRTLAGHVRNEWVGAVTWSIEDKHSAMTLATIMSSGLAKVYVLPDAKDWLSADVAKWWAGTVVRHRVGLGLALSDEDAATLQLGVESVPAGKPHHVWSVPGWSQDAIAAAYSSSGLA